MHRLIAPLVLVTTLAGCGTAMAFNCKGINLPSNIVICSNPDLTRLADERQQIYNETRSRLTPDQQAALWEDQKAWVRSYATACGIPPDNAPAIPAPPSVIECFKRSGQARAAYLRTYGLPRSATSASPDQPRQVAVSDIDDVALVQKDQLSEIPVQINGAITLLFILDSGASDVQIPFDVFSTLVRTKTIMRSDIVGVRTYVLADGTKQESPKFLLRELKVGNQILQNVPASVGSPTGALLLGQSFLSHFDSWTLDNKRQILTLVGKRAATAGEAASEASTTAETGPTASITAPITPRNPQPSAQSVVVCGRPVEYAVDRSGVSTRLLGVWAGNWNNAGQLCGGLIVERIDRTGAADVIYIYGPSKPGSRLSWKQQRRTAILRNGVLSFHDDQGSTFQFDFAGFDALNASFTSRSGKLTGFFQRSH